MNLEQFVDAAWPTTSVICRAGEIAREMGLASIVPHALFLALYEKNRREIEDLLRVCGVDSVRYCQKVATEINAMPKRKTGKVPPLHPATERIVRAANGGRGGMQHAKVEDLIKALLEADGIGGGGQGAARPTGDEGDPFAELNALVGLDSVKAEIKKLVELVKFNQARQRSGLCAEPPTSHFVFTGNPGTGKTTVARIIARIYKKLGVLRKGHLVEVDRSKLVAGYVGQTAIQTDAVIDSAIDGVLFIDEAYSLAADHGSDYGQEAIATLLKRMEDQRNRLVVIVAGYEDEMHRFVESNPGLQSRFTKYIRFSDYSGDELVWIFLAMLSAQNYTCSKAALSEVRVKMAAVAAKGGKVSGNARFVRNFLSQTKERMAMRVNASGTLSKQALQQIEPEDIA